MGISLTKGGNVSLSKESPGLDEIVVGLGWNVNTSSGNDFDLDASAFLLAPTGKVRSNKDFVYFGNKSTIGVEHKGDNLTGEGEGDDEQIEITLSKVPADINKVAVAVTIYQGEARGQDFGHVTNAHIRLLNKKNNKEIVRYDLSECAAAETGMILGEVYRHGTDWKFRAVGQGFKSGLEQLAANFGVGS
jgi:tellurium resistance protein TerD